MILSRKKKDLKYSKDIGKGGWRDGSEVNNMYSFRTGPEFPAPHIITTRNLSSKESDALFWPPHVHRHQHSQSQTHMHTNMYTLTHTFSLLRNLFLMVLTERGSLWFCVQPQTVAFSLQPTFLGNRKHWELGGTFKGWYCFKSLSFLYILLALWGKCISTVLKTLTQSTSLVHALTLKMCLLRLSWSELLRECSINKTSYGVMYQNMYKVLDLISRTTK